MRVHRIIVAMALASSMPGANIFVTSLQQKTSGIGGCSLQEAIYSANFDNNVAVTSYKVDGSPNYVATECVAGSGADTIILPSGTTAAVFQMSKVIDDIDNFAGPAANPMITSTITIVAGGSELIWVGSKHARVFVVNGTGKLTLFNAYIKGFSAKGGDGGSGGGGGMGAGGAIYIESGVLTVQNCTFDGNAAIGGNGSAWTGDLFDGGGGGGLSGNGGMGIHGLFGGSGGGGARGNGTHGGSNGGSGGGGGGGTLTDGIGSAGGMNCGANGGESDGDDGADAQCPGGGGGGAAEFTILGGAHGGSGGYGGGGGSGAGGGTSEGDGGAGGFGGGGGTGGQGGDGGYGGGGGASDGTAIFFTPAQPGRFAGRGGAELGGGGAALGGAIFSHFGTVLIQNSTFANNSVLRGSAGTGSCDLTNGCPLADNGQDEGGAIFAVNGSLTVQNSTISGNTSTGEGAGIVVDQEAIVAGNFVLHPPTSFTLQNTIISNPSARECFYTPGVSASGAGNLIVNDFGCPGVVSGADPLLGPLQINVPGNIPTLGFGQNSPAFNAADPVTSLQKDQRGVDRPQAGGFDIGALELCVSLLPIQPCVQVANAPPDQPVILSLTVQVSGAGVTSPAAGTHGEPIDSVVILSATPQSGNSFVQWLGNVTDPFSASTTVVMTAPQTVTATFVAGSTALGGNILTKSGPQNARVWPVNVANATSSAVTAHSTQINTFSLTQVAGAACTPVLQTVLPASAGDLAPGSSTIVNLGFDFTGCPAAARFTAQATFSANGGGVTGSMTRTNQFQ